MPCLPGLATINRIQTTRQRQSNIQGMAAAGWHQKGKAAREHV